MAGGLELDNRNKVRKVKEIIKNSAYVNCL